MKKYIIYSMVGLISIAAVAYTITKVQQPSKQSQISKNIGSQPSNEIWAGEQETWGAKAYSQGEDVKFGNEPSITIPHELYHTAQQRSPRNKKR